jgi:hypothetical protein
MSRLVQWHPHGLQEAPMLVAPESSALVDSLATEPAMGDSFLRMEIKSVK